MTRWAELSDGTPVPGSPFVRGVVYDGSVPVYLPVSDPGPALDFSFGFKDMPIVRRTLLEALIHVAPNDMQAVDAVIDDDDKDFVILNAVKLIDCIDESRSMTEPLLEEQIRAGWQLRYRSVALIHLNYEQIGDADFFRLSEWPMALIASDRIVRVLQGFEASGVRWEEV